MDNFFKLIIKKPEGNQAYSLGAFLVDVAFVIWAYAFSEGERLYMWIFKFYIIGKLLAELDRVSQKEDPYVIRNKEK